MSPNVIYMALFILIVYLSAVKLLCKHLHADNRKQITVTNSFNPCKRLSSAAILNTSSNLNPIRIENVNQSLTLIRGYPTTRKRSISGILTLEPVHRLHTPRIAYNHDNLKIINSRLIPLVSHNACYLHRIDQQTC